MEKKILRMVGIIVLGMIILIITSIIIIKLPQKSEPQYSVMPTATQNIQSITEMEYLVDDLNAQFLGLETWLQMAKDMPSLYIYGSWQFTLNERFAEITMDLKEIRELLPQEDREKLECLNEVQARFFAAEGIIFAGLSKNDQLVIDEGIAIVSELKIKIEEEWDWK